MSQHLYGSVVVFLNNGRITGISTKEDFNPTAFIDSVEKVVSCVIVKSKKESALTLLPVEGDKLAEVAHDCIKPVIKIIPNGSKMDNNDKKIDDE